MTNDWNGHDPTGAVDEAADAEEMAAREEAYAKVARLIAEGDYAGARKELDALDQPDDAKQLGAEELLSEALAAQNPVQYLRRQLNKRDPAGTLEVQKEWTGEFRPRDWLCPKWLPMGRVALLTGTGGGGKSLLALQLSVAVASFTGKDTTDGRGRNVLADPQGIGKAPKVLSNEDSRPVVFATWEDEHDEFLRRLHWLPECDRKQLETRLHVVNLAGTGPLWGPQEGDHRDSRAELTANGMRFESYVRETMPRLMVIDPISAAYAASENNRPAVRAWLSHLNALAAEIGAAILLVGHPPKYGEEDYSGTSDWRAGIRALWTLKPEVVRGYEGAPDTNGDPKRAAVGYALTLAKANYAKEGRQAWLRLQIDFYKKQDAVLPTYAAPGDVKAMFWAECAPLDSAGAYHKLREWDSPREKKTRTGTQQNGARDSAMATSSPGAAPQTTDKHGLLE